MFALVAISSLLMLIFCLAVIVILQGEKIDDNARLKSQFKGLFIILSLAYFVIIISYLPHPSLIAFYGLLFSFLFWLLTAAGYAYDEEHEQWHDNTAIFTSMGIIIVSLLTLNQSKLGFNVTRYFTDLIAVVSPARFQSGKSTFAPRRRTPAGMMPTGGYFDDQKVQIDENYLPAMPPLERSTPQQRASSIPRASEEEEKAEIYVGPVRRVPGPRPQPPTRPRWITPDKISPIRSKSQPRQKEEKERQQEVAQTRAEKVQQPYRARTPVIKSKNIKKPRRVVNIPGAVDPDDLPQRKPPKVPFLKRLASWLPPYQTYPSIY